jgi:hypothetical protein
MAPPSTAMKPGIAVGQPPAKKMSMPTSAAMPPGASAANGNSRIPYRPPSVPLQNATSPVIPRAIHGRPAMNIQMTVSDGQKSKRMELNPHSAAKINPLLAAQQYRQHQPVHYMGTKLHPLGANGGASQPFQMSVGVPYAPDAPSAVLGSANMQEQMTHLMAHRDQGRGMPGAIGSLQSPQSAAAAPNQLIQHARSILANSETGLHGAGMMGVHLEQPSAYGKSNLKNANRKANK